MTDNEVLIGKIANDLRIIDFQTIPARLFVTLSYLQFGIRTCTDSPGREIAIETFNNLLKALTTFYPDTQGLFDSGWDEENDLVIETEEIPECLQVQIPY